MKLKNKIYIIQFFIFVSFFLFFYFLYTNYEKNYEKTLKNSINQIIETNKYHIEYTFRNINKDFRSNQNLYFKIHEYTKNEYLKNPNINLDTLKQNIKLTFDIKDIDIDILLINNNYTITDATFKKDIGFNLSVIKDAKMYLDKTKIDSKIYVANVISVDMLDSNINIYSYSKLNENQFFEVGFKLKNNIYIDIKRDLENIHKETNNKITIYRVAEDSKGDEFYDDLLNKNLNSNISKKEYEVSLIKFPKNEPTTNNYINAFRKQTIIKEYSDNKIIVYLPLLNVNKDISLWDNLMMKVEIDISEQIKTLNETKENFIIFGSILLLLLGSLYYIIRYNFYKPMIDITQTLEKEEKINSLHLLDKSDEFGILVKEYNKLYDTLKSEIKLNSKLLDENKRFIVDTVHQIRTPLTNIMMNGEMVKKFQNDDNLSKYIDKIDASVNMLSNSYEDLAYITTYDTIEYQSSNISISNMLNDRIKFFSTISKVNLKEIVSNIQDDIYIYINGIELERIIDNNISNAIKYGTINKPIFINLYLKEKNKIVLEFYSFGKAIEHPSKVFDKNYREDEGKRGLGLGLNMVKNICDKYNIYYSLRYENDKNIFTYTFGL
ncbi:sensor histidine kinase [Aliarcobacter cryaerophilus]|uniref:sensor histidine kinase n=1 Tax=Aliarcobacter cryaerophilus TaxID=28198 RepID=UPI0021B5308B|nr:HAMP domain-containing sensor histidine kinase [Aliarcobacter cryaerophilus]MCT7515496.1 HAMP domain-containing histidine kinase [Aliarcobacter cryaerophilus]